MPATSLPPSPARTDIEAADPGRRIVQHRKAVPAAVTALTLQPAWPAWAEHRGAVGTGQSALATMISGCVALLSTRRTCRCVGQRLQGFQDRRDQLIVVTRVAHSPITPTGRLRRASVAERALSTEASKRGLAPMISTASACSIAFDGRVEDVAAGERGIQCCAILAAIDVLRAERRHQKLERVDLLDRREVTGDGAIRSGVVFDTCP